MPSIFVYFKSINKQIKQSVSQELLWYDVEKKKMLKFKGGKLEYIYAFDEELQKYRLLPKVANLEIKVNKKISHKIGLIGWFDNYEQENENTKINVIDDNNMDNYMEFDVPEDEVDNFVNELDIEGFDYEIR